MPMITIKADQLLEYSFAEAYVEEICKKLRNTAKYYGEERIKNGVILGTVNLEELNVLPVEQTHNIGGKQYVYVPTIVTSTLGNVEGNVATFFEEDALNYYDTENKQ